VTGQTITEKIMSRQNVAGNEVRPGDIVDLKVDGFLALGNAGVHAAYRRIGFPDGPPKVFDPERIYVVNDHLQPPRDFLPARANYDTKRVGERLGIKHVHSSEMGVCHQIMLDYGYVRPGELVFGNDSHTCSLGAVNALATGIGLDEAAYLWAFGELYFTVPETIKVVLRGQPKPYQFGKDIILYLAGQLGDDFAQNYALEFTGPLASAMDISSRLTIADHAVEVGGTYGLFEADDKTNEYIRARTDKPYQPVSADADATYAREIEIDCDTFGFQVAKPFRFDNVAPVTDVLGVKIDQARIGSCANGRYEDIAQAAQMLKGRKVAPGVHFYVSPSTLSVYKQMADTGVMSTLLEAGVQVQQPGCAICQYEIVLNEEICITSTTRNYHGRFGGATSSEAQIYLASPATVTAAAIAGEIVDPTEFLV
jgi:3-isopropylmalate/(R)-2-methylmalate dehydratase large subunit